MKVMCATLKDEYIYRNCRRRFRLSEAEVSYSTKHNDTRKSNPPMLPTTQGSFFTGAE